MGDLIGEVVNSELYFIPRREFDRVITHSREPRTIGLYAQMARLNALFMVAKAGSGHIGSSFSAMDIFTHVHLCELNRDRGDVFFSSKGHDAPGLYAVQIAQGLLPEAKLHELRRLGGLPGHPDIGTPGLATNTGSLGMGISKAKGMILANRMQGKLAKIIVMTGDGELQEGQIWESLISAAARRMSELVVIVDHNKFQSDFAVARTSDLGDLEAKFAAFGCHVARVDGNDASALAECFKATRDEQHRPQVIIADTVKGKGVSFMEGTRIDSDVDMYRFHSGAPKAEEYRAAVAELEISIAQGCRALGIAPVEIAHVDRPVVTPPAANAQRLVPAYAKALAAAAERDRRIVALDADLALDMGLLDFAARAPDRFIECGIAEQDMVSMAGGLALKGALPLVHSFSCFLSTRPNEQIYNNATERTQIIYVGGLSGVLPAGPGHSHQSVRDISALGGVPDMVMVEPCCTAEVAPLLDWCIESHRGPSFLRLISVPYATEVQLPPGYIPQRGKGVQLRDGRQGVIIASGLVMVAEALRAAALLDARGLSLAVINLPWLNLIDAEWLQGIARTYPVIVTIDNHYLHGGQGSMIGAALARLRERPLLVNLGLDEIPPCGTNDEVLGAVGLTGQSIAEAVSRCIRPEALT